MQRLVIQRRLFLAGLGALASSQWLMGCQDAKATVFNAYFLRNSLPVQLLKQFQQQLPNGSRTNWTPRPELRDLFNQLQQWQTGSDPLPAVALVSLGDYWLATAIRQGLIQPLELGQLKSWSTLPNRWQDLVRRDRQGYPNPQGPIWGAPYRWGTTVIAYRRDKFRDLGWTPTDWSDLWRPELRHRFSLLDHPREVIGLTLKKLGQSYNSDDPQRLPQLAEALASLNRQVKFYSSDTYLQPLLLGTTWAAVGWSTDVLPLLRRDDQIAAVVPRSGTALWADLWVQASKQSTSPLIQQWIDYWWQPQTANELSQFSNAVSPLVTDLQANSPAKSLLLPNQAAFQRSEFLLPLSQATIAQYQTLWQEMRRSGVNL